MWRGDEGWDDGFRPHEFLFQLGKNQSPDLWFFDKKTTSKMGELTKTQQSAGLATLSFTIIVISKRMPGVPNYLIETRQIT